MDIPDKIPDARVFSYEAMNTTFTMRFPDMDERSANGLARECYEVLDRLESLLSRFVEDSDVSRINSMRAGQTLYVAEETHACLLAALHAYEQTGGLFDVTLGSRIEHLKSKARGAPPAVTGKLTVHPDAAAVTCEEPGRIIDLGGIGKGFALDRMKAMLAEWDAPEFMLAAGASSLLAHGERTWPVDLAGAPRTPENRPAQRRAQRLRHHRAGQPHRPPGRPGCHARPPLRARLGERRNRRARRSLVHRPPAPARR